MKWLLFLMLTTPVQAGEYTDTCLEVAASVDESWDNLLTEEMAEYIETYGVEPETEGDLQ